MKEFGMEDFLFEDLDFEKFKESKEEKIDL
jgi:hypothetical protein